MKKIPIYILFILGYALFTTSFVLKAGDFTLNIHKEGKAANKQYCYTDFEIDLDGNWSTSSMYSNGKRIESIRLYSILTVISKDDQTIITIPQNHHVKGSGGGSAREERTTVSGKLPTAVAQLISKSKTTYSCKKVSDINADNIKKVVEIAKWVLSLM